MTPFKFEQLQNLRRRIAEWEELAAALDAGDLKTRTGSDITTEDTAGFLRTLISRNEAVLAEHDPDNLTLLQG